MKESFELNLTTNLSSKELINKLSSYEPWGHQINFSNGVSTSQFKQRTPFNHNTVHKIKTVEKAISFERFRGGNILDIGCNSGHNSIYLASNYGMKPTGIDVSPRHIEVSKLLSKIATGVDGKYKLGNAETFCHKNYFDIVLHFGTLYHLPNPLLSLETTYKNLKTGGYLALETQVYDHPVDSNLCYFMHMHNNDSTNFWALSTNVLKQYLQLLGFFNIELLIKVSPDILAENMSRVIIIAQK